jgi:2-polyprenyl-3-methyl-5-hydroxy-6-metoxy-1,4-benzoquinol methylase
MQSNWTREQVEALARDERFQYQRIDLPYGLATRGKDRSQTALRVLPEDLSGKSFLDVGCRHGYYCFEALARGAARVVGLDISREAIRAARLLADCRGEQARFDCLDVAVDRIDETFDYVLCLNVLHHTSDPIAALDNLMAATRETLVLEIIGFGRRHQRRCLISALEAVAIRRSPVIYIAKDLHHTTRQLPKSLITRAACVRMLRQRPNAFAQVEERRSARRDRHILIASRTASPGALPKG